MSKIINFSIDLSLLDKSKIVEGKNGGKYYNFTMLVNDKADNYGNDCKVILPQSKEQRENKEAKVYVGNGKVVFNGNQKSVQTSEKTNNNNYL